MSKTIWLALFCLVGLGPAIAIKLVGSPTSLVAKPALDQTKIEPAFAANRSAKSDRLELLAARAEKDIIAPAAKPMPAETRSTSPEPIKNVDIDHGVVHHHAPVVENVLGRHADRNWQNANAKVTSVESPRWHTKSEESKQSTGKHPPNKTAEVWHCRQDAVGSLLRSLDLSPRCSL
jgi:hypothetical protein